MKKILLLCIIFYLNAYAYESEERLQAVIIGKVAKYITWDQKEGETFKIIVLNQKTENLFNKIYHDRNIKNRKVEIVYVEKLSDISSSDILYISQQNSAKLEKILQIVKNKNIFLVSDIKGFAQKGGMMQIYFVSQKPKLRINLDNTKKENLKIKSSLLRISDVIQEDN